MIKNYQVGSQKKGNFVLHDCEYVNWRSSEVTKGHETHI